MVVNANGRSSVTHEFTELDYRMPSGWLNRIKRTFGVKMEREPVARDVYTEPVDYAPIMSLYARMLDVNLERGEILAQGFSKQARKLAKGYGIKLLSIAKSEAERRLAISRQHTSWYTV